MHANVNIERNSWRLPPDETVQVGDPRSKKDDEELVYGGPSEGRNWRGILLSLLVISVVIMGIILAIYTLGYVDELLYWSGRRMDLSEVLGGELRPHRLPSVWLSARHFVFHADDGSLALWSVQTGAITTLVTNHTMRQLDVQGYQVSADRKYVLFRHNVKPVFQHTFTAFYTVYDVFNDHHLPIRLKPGAATHSRLQFASWVGNTTSLLLVHDNDLYLQRTPIPPAAPAKPQVRLTASGVPGEFYNGVPNWLYQEEGLLGDSEKAVWSSVDGSRLLFATFNDTGVRLLQVPWMGPSQGAAGATDATFPSSRTVHYPTPGSSNPDVRLFVLDLEGGNQTATTKWEVVPPLELNDTDFYITAADWVGDSNDFITVTWMNRAQNLSVVTTCHQDQNWTCHEVHIERALESSWVDVEPSPVFSADGSSLLLLCPVQEGAADYFTHITHVSLAPPQRLAVISHGRHEVERIVGWHTAAHLVYYLGTSENGPGQRHLYVAPDPGLSAASNSLDMSLEARRLEPRCLTCRLGQTEHQYENCTYFSALLSPETGHVVIECQGHGTPRAGLHAPLVSLKDKFKLVRMLYVGFQLRGNPASPGPSGVSSGGDIGSRLAQLALPTVKTFEVPLPQNCRARVKLLLPPSWREELRDAAFPVLVEVNGRPGSQAVSDLFSVDWGTYMSSRNDVVYIRIDVRGAGGQGRRASKALYRHLGGVEVQDHITVLRYLLETLPFLDETRVGVWGWGYGGYVTSMLLGTQQSIFKCGIAVSPVTDWLHYNSAFTEKVLGSPTENFKGYVEADATQRARYVPNHALFLIHGLADLSTPFSHGVALARALSEAGILFRYHSYADEGHMLEGVIEHTYTSMEDYLRDCLSLDDDPGSS
ncbi:inactive dipeptidyl peptidase 10 isoform X1 [Cloeon dipterum]|uniref:inactive dipeptidyl peptidase 10 isoform X1 n=1 Tax=Cloeon dipterum TaxID=197152 RepID=UPI00321F773E